MQEYERPTQRRASGDEELADRLDRATSSGVPAHLVDEVLRRAIEYQLGEDYSQRSLDDHELEKVAGEVGIQPEHLRRALAEVRAEGVDEPLRRRDRLFAPPRMVETRNVHLTRREAEMAIVDWMRQHEGMRMRARTDDGGVWEKDSHLLTSLRMGLRLGRGSGALRDARDVTHTVHGVTADEQVISLEADSSVMSKVGTTIVGVGAAGAVIGGGAAVAAGADPAVASLAAAGGFGLWAGGAILGVRMWARRLRDGLRRAVEGAAHPELATRDDSLAGQFARLRRDWSAGDRRPR